MVAAIIALIAVGLALLVVFNSRSAERGAPDAADAEALAQMLVTELALYNEETIETAKRTGQLPESLRKDIERSRKMYQDRIPETEHGDHFEQAMQHILRRE